MSAVSSPVPVETPKPLSPQVAPPAPQSGKPWKWLIILAVLVAGGLALWLALRSPSQPAAQQAFIGIRTAKVATGDLVATSRVGGQTAAIDFSNVIAPILRGPDSNRDLILIFLAPSGSFVKKGDIVAQIDGQSMQDHVDDLKDTIEAAEADIQKRKAEQEVEYENLQQTIRVAKSQVDKFRLDARAAEVKTDIERQLIQLALEEAEAAYKQQLSDLENKRRVHAATVRILEFTKERHVRHHDRHVNDVKRFTIRAPMDGLAVMTSVWRGGEMGQIQQGDRVSPGQLFMKIVNPNKMQVEGTINQAESSDFRVGQLATIRLDAFPGMTFEGKVHSIGALAVGGWRQNYYVRNVPVRIAIHGADPRLIPDLSASGDVVLGKVTAKTIAPRAAMQEEKGKFYAQVRKGETWEKRQVALGLKNDTHVVVLEGLNPGEEVRLN